MKIIKTRFREDHEVIYEAIIDCGGKLPKKEKERITKDFLVDFLRYVNTNHDYNNQMYEAVRNLFHDYGSLFTISSNTVRHVGHYVDLFQFCKISTRLSHSSVCSLLDKVGGGPRQSLNVWSKLMAHVIASELVDDITQLGGLYYAGRFFFNLVCNDSESDRFYIFRTAFDLIRSSLRKEKVPFNERIKVRFVLAMSCMHGAIFESSVYNDGFRDLVEMYLYRDNAHSRIAPILPAYYNPFSPTEYALTVIENHLEAEDEFASYLESCEHMLRLEWLTRLVKAQGNNIKFCNTRDEIISCIPELCWTQSKRCITNYRTFKRVFENGCAPEYTIAFLQYGDISTVPSEDIQRLLSDKLSIGYITARSDAKTQLENLLRIPNGMTYLVQSIDLLPLDALITLMHAYVDYMEGNTALKAVNNISLDIYIASYIKKKVPMDIIITRCPKMLRYIDTLITDYPVDYHDLNEWLDVAENAPAINITDGLQFGRLMRANRYVALNYHHIPFSPELFGFEEIIRDSKELVRIAKKHPGYYFDLKSDEVREIIMGMLSEHHRKQKA